MRNQFFSREANKTSSRVPRHSCWLCKSMPMRQKCFQPHIVHFPCVSDLFWLLPMILSQLTVNSSKLAFVLWDSTGSLGLLMAAGNAFLWFFRESESDSLNIIKPCNLLRMIYFTIRSDNIIKKKQRLLTLIHKSKLRDTISLHYIKYINICIKFKASVKINALGKIY